MREVSAYSKRSVYERKGAYIEDFLKMRVGAIGKTLQTAVTGIGGKGLDGFCGKTASRDP